MIHSVDRIAKQKVNDYLSKYGPLEATNADETPACTAAAFNGESRSEDNMEEIQPVPYVDTMGAGSAIDITGIREKRCSRAQQKAELINQEPGNLQSVFMFEKSRRGNRMVRFLLRFLQETENLSPSQSLCQSAASAPAPDSTQGGSKASTGKSVSHQFHDHRSDRAQTDLPLTTQAAHSALDHLQACDGLKWAFLSGTCIGKAELARLQKVFSEYQIIYLATD